MIHLLHAGLMDGRLTLWAERSLASDMVIKGRRGRKPLKPRAAAHPFAAGLEGLVVSLKAAGLSVDTPKGKGNQAVAWLPSAGTMPLPSSPLVGEAPPSKAPVALAPWAVPCLSLGGDLTLDLLSRCSGQATLAPGVAIGSDLAFWAHVLRFAASLVARQRFLPGLRLEAKRALARWEMAPAAGDFKRMADLAGAIPGAARALGSAEALEPPSTAASALVESFAGAMVDHMVRSSARPQEIVRAVGRRGKGAFDSLHDQWLYALSTAEGVLEAQPAELAVLAKEVASWKQPLAATDAAPYRLCFRLEEPGEDEDGEGWRVSYLLQAADDPSLLVPAQEAWSARGRKAAAIKREGAAPKAFLLAALGQAAGICPRIEDSLRSRAPEGYSLDASGAYDFLIAKALLLEQAGFGVFLPAWWSRKGTKQRLSVRAKVRSPKLKARAGMSLDRVVTFDWEVALGEETLSEAELEELARLKMPLVRLRGQWVVMSAEDIRAAIEAWRRKGSAKATVRDVIRMALGAEEDEGELAVKGVTADGWVGELLDRLEGRRALEEREVPPTFSGMLRPYQGRGYSWLAFLSDLGLGACLADDMGLGKTIQTLALLLRNREAGEARPVLLVCPTSLLSNWKREAQRFTPTLDVLVRHGVTRSKGKGLVGEVEGKSLVITSYSLLHRDLEHLQEVDWAGVVLDEAQNIKNAETRQAKAARSLKAGFRLALTGTPVENTVGDLWSIMEFLNPGLLGTRASFKKRFFMPIQVERDPEAAERLKGITGPFVLRRLKTDRAIIDDLPDKLEMKVYCTLTKEQVSLYRAVVKEAEEALNDAEGIQRKGLVLATLSKLKQVCNHPAQLLGDGSPVANRSGKVARLTEILEEVLASRDKTLIFSQFAEMGEMLKGHLQETFGLEVPFLHGGVPKRRRDEMVQSFQSPQGPPVFILSLKAGGTGLNLTEANHVLHFDRWWNPAVEDQATDRAFRIGQTKNVQVHKLVCAGTMEEAIDEMIERKKGVAASVVGSGEGWLTELSNEDLRRVFALRAEALGD